MKSSCVLTIELNTLTDVPYQMTWEVALKILNNSCVYITRSVITRFLPVDTDVAL